TADTVHIVVFGQRDGADRLNVQVGFGDRVARFLADGAARPQMQGARTGRIDVVADRQGTGTEAADADCSGRYLIQLQVGKPERVGAVDAPDIDKRAAVIGLQHHRVGAGHRSGRTAGIDRNVV